MKELRRIEGIAESRQTPFYLFDEQVVVERIGHLRNFLTDKIRICYAMKANPFILKAACEAADLVEVCSPGELAICQSVGVPSSKLVISGVYKARSLVQELVSQPSPVFRYTVESVAQYELLSSVARENEKAIDVLLRLTSGNQFGMDVRDLKRIAGECETNPFVNVCGIQFFSGTQKQSAKWAKRELKALDDLAKELQETCGANALEIEYGPGLAVSYGQAHQADSKAAEQEFLHVLADSLNEMRFAGTTTLEIGRGIAASCGYYVTRVVDVKTNGSHNYAIVDGGKHQLSYYDPALAFDSPACHVVPSRTSEPEETWTICGALCTTNDLMVRRLDCPQLQVGDLVVFPNAGAYCMTEGPALLLSRDLPSIYLCKKLDGVNLARERVQTSRWNTPLGASCTQKR